MTDHWVEAAQSAQARLATMEANFRPAIERVKIFKANFGIKERSTGEIDIDYNKFVENLGKENALELKKVIEQTYE